MAFILNRSIHHSVMLCNEIFHHVTSHYIPFVFLKFDKVDWSFSGGHFDTMDFGPVFHIILKAITYKAAQRIIINSNRSPLFFISYSGCQGCQLSPRLFVFVMETFTRNLQRESPIGRLTGISIPQLDCEYIPLCQQLSSKIFVGQVHSSGSVFGFWAIYQSTKLLGKMAQSYPYTTRNKIVRLGMAGVYILEHLSWLQFFRLYTCSSH